MSIEALADQQKQALKPIAPWESFGGGYSGWYSWTSIYHQNLRLHELTAVEAMAIYNMVESVWQEAAR